MRADSAVRTRAGRVVFVVGGSMFVLAGCAAFAQTPASPLFEWAQQGLIPYDLFTIVPQVVSGAMSALAMVLFAVGAPSGGSVVARKPLGVITLLVFAVWPYVTQVVWAILPYEVMAAWPPPLSIAFSLVPVVAGLIAVFEIARIGAVPGGWRWLPAVAYLAVVGSIVVVQVAQNLGWNNGEAYAPIVMVPYAIFIFSTFIVPLVLGVAAIWISAAAGRRARKDARAAAQEEVAAEAEPAQVFPPPA
ncbi:hypothetical protein [Microbacterium sp. Root180]|uniref:hypothetical protein n=1 Tax=Microbacterium sp. Root180 TaxID=1736483 RepID=UPI0012F7C541|nr:hypothetical protein [Microbacterium sp. Root180]